MQRFWVNRRSDIHRFFSNLSYNIQYLRMSRWHITLIYATVLFLFYILFGLILSNDFVDGYFALFATLKELGVVIEYIGLLFAVQIPIFILLLEKIRDSGDIRRLSLLGVIYFREILATYIILSFLLLFSPRASYYYFPTIAITVVSSYAIIQSIQLLFKVDQLKQREVRYIEKLTRRSLTVSELIRTSSNNFFTDLKNSLYVTHGLFASKHDKNESKKTYSIRASRVGVIKSINVKKLDEIIIREYYNKAPQIIEEQQLVGQPSDRDAVQLALSTRPGSDIKDQSKIMELCRFSK